MTVFPMISSKVYAAIELMDAHQGFCMVLLTAALALCAGLSCIFAYKSIKAMKESEIERARPMVVLESFNAVPVYGIRMRNTGLTAAHGIAISMKPALESYLMGRTQKAISIRFLNQPVDFFPPNASVETLVGTLDEIRQANSSMLYQGSIRYSDAKGRRYEDAVTVDFSLYANLVYSGKHTIHHVHAELEKMRRSIENIASGFSKIRVVTQDLADYREEERKVIEEIERAHGKNKS
jgi:hypothetical protein